MPSTAPKRALAALLAVSLAASLVSLAPERASADPDVQSSAPKARNDEVPEGYVGIYDAEDLLAIEADLDGKYVLMADVDLSGYSGPLSIGGARLRAAGFTGELDGNGHAVRGMTVSLREPDGPQALTGLFGSLSGATVRDLAFEGASVRLVDYHRSSDSIRYIGVLCGYAGDSTISNCTVEGSVYVEDTGDELWVRMGGLCGSADGESLIENCVNRADVISPPNNGFTIYSGGICGELGGSGVSIRGCSNYGAVTGSDAGGVCGNAGTNGSSFSECANYGDVTATRIGAYVTSNAGGIAGDSSSSFEKCMNAGTVRGGHAAGICASADTVKRCYNVGSVESAGMAAGIMTTEASSGGKHVLVADCFNAGEVRAGNVCGKTDATGGTAAGIVSGGNMWSTEVIRCYNSGSVSVDCNDPEGGIASHIWTRGKSYNTGTESTDNYALASAMLKAGTIESWAKCTELSEDEMKRASSFAGFDFEGVWGMGPDEYPYPTLRGIPGGYASNDPDEKPDVPPAEPWQAPDPLAAAAASELAAFVTSGTEGVKGQSSILRELTHCSQSEWVAAAEFYDRPIWEGSEPKRCDLFDQELGSDRVLEYSFSPNYVAIEHEGGCIVAFGRHNDMDLKAAGEHLRNALQVYGRYAEVYGAERVFVTGSGYGGSLAAYVCTLTGAKGCIFNASGAGYDAAILNNYLDLAGYTGVDGIDCTHYYTPAYYDGRLSSGILGLRDAMDDFWSYPSVSVADNGLAEDASEVCSMYSFNGGAFSFNSLLRQESSKATVRFSMEPAALFDTLAAAVQGKPDLSLFSKSVVLSLGTSGPDAFSSVWKESENWFTQVVLAGDAGSGTDRVKTGNWNDIIVTGKGDSKVDGGWGGDLYVIGGDNCSVTIDDYTSTGLQSGVNAKKFIDLGNDLLDVVGSSDVAWDGLRGTYKVWKLLSDESLFQKDRIYFPDASLRDLAVTEENGYYVVVGGGATVRASGARLLGQDFEIVDKNGDKASLRTLASGGAGRASEAAALDAASGHSLASVALRGADAAFARSPDGALLHEFRSDAPFEEYGPYGHFSSPGDGSFEFEYDASSVEVSFSGGTVSGCRMALMAADGGSGLLTASSTGAAGLGDGELLVDFSSGEPELVLLDREGGAVGRIELDRSSAESQPTEDIGGADSAEVGEQVYTGSPIEPGIGLRLSGIDLEEGADYALRYEGNDGAGTARAVAEGRGKYGGSKEVLFRISPASLAGAEVALPPGPFAYEGSPVEPGVRVSLGSAELAEGVDFEVSYSGNDAAGIATATVEGIGNYAGTATATFEIEKVAPAPGPAPSPKPQPATASRLGGADRYKTMVLVSQEAFPEKGSCGTVIIARGDNFPDALAAAGLAGVEGGQVLLTQTAFLTAEARAEIKRLGASKAFVIGDKNSVSAKAFDEIKSLVGGNATRLGGADRYETALRIYKAGSGGWGTTAIVAIGSKPADALSASPVAYAMRAPIFLADGNGNLSAAVLGEMSKGGFDTVLIMGSEHSVSGSAEKSLKRFAKTVRFSGADRYETSQLVANWALRSGFTCKNVVMTAGYEGKFADALVASSLGGRNVSPLLLADNGSVADRQIAKVISPNKGGVEEAYVIGDENSLSRKTFAAVLKAVS